MSNPISEFKKLVKESSKDWEKNKERFSERIPPTETQFSREGENWDAPATRRGPDQDGRGSEDGTETETATETDKNSEDAIFVERNEIAIKQMEKACNNIRILLNVLKFELSELKGLLTKEEYKNVEFSIHYQPGKR